MAPSPYTTAYTVLGKTYKYTHNYDYPTDTTYDYGYNPYNNDTVRAVVAGYVIGLGIIIGLQVIGLIIVAIVYYRRQKRRKAWYGPMAEHYRNGGLPPWVVGGGGSVKAPLVQHDYGSYVPRNSYSTASARAIPVQNDYYNNSYPPTSPQPQYDPPNRSSAFMPYEGPPHQYRGY